MAHLINIGKVSVNARDSAGNSPLHIAAGGCTLLPLYLTCCPQLAAECNQVKAAKYLIAQAASVDTKDANGRTALDIAEALKWKVWDLSL